MRNPGTARLFDQVEGQNMKFLINDIDGLLTYSASNTLQQLFSTGYFAKMGILKHIMQQPNKGWYMQVLTNFFDFIKDESRKNPEIKLANLISIIKLMKENKRDQAGAEPGYIFWQAFNFLTCSRIKRAGV